MLLLVKKVGDVDGGRYIVLLPACEGGRFRGHVHAAVDLLDQHSLC